MDKLQASRIVGGNPEHGRAAGDFYPTPPDVTNALLDFLKLPKCMTIWEPAAGNGVMVDVMQSRGYHVIGTDIATGTDFLKADVPESADMIITNPPFSLSEKFILRAEDTGLPFAFLLKSQYWHAARRQKLFDDVPPHYVLPLTWRPDFCGKGAPLMDVMWCVWLGIRPGQTAFVPLRRPREEEHE